MKKLEPFTKTHPFLAKIKERYSLCKPGSQKTTQHIVLDLTGSGLTYEVGDSLGIFPTNDPELVDRTLKAMKATGDERITDREGQEHSLKAFLTIKANINEFSKKFVTELAKRQMEPAKKKFLESLLEDSNKELLRQYHRDHEIWDALAEQSEIDFTPQELCSLFMPLLPRLYSIASSQGVVGEEVHLTVSLTRFVTNGIERFGVCTHYLCSFCPLDEPIVPVYIQPHHGFTLPQESDAALIMIGPGTGIAPFRAFLQERVHKRHKGQNWLFFGEWSKNSEFYYEEEWETFIKDGHLRLDTAFSRDQNYKIYVQHRMLEHGQELFQWLEDGAHLFVCGDAKHMAKDVDAALFEIIKVHGKLSDTEVKAYIKELRTEKRYLRDVY